MLRESMDRRTVCYHVILYCMRPEDAIKDAIKNPCLR